MKTLGMFLGSMIVAAIVAVGAAVIVVGSTCNVAHAQEEAIISTTCQLLQRHDASNTAMEEDDDLYATLRGTADSLLPENVHGTRKTVTSSVIVKKETFPANQPSGTDLYTAATDYLGNIANPSYYELQSIIFTGIDTLTFRFGLEEGSIDVCVNINTGEAYMPDFVLEERITAAREDISRNMGLDSITDVHIDSASIVYYLYKYWSWPQPYSTTTIGARVGNYALTLTSTQYVRWNWQIIDIGDWEDYTYVDRTETVIYNTYNTYKPIFTLTSFVDMTTGVDYVAEVGRAMIDLLNPESANPGISYWSMTGGKLTLHVDMHHQPTDPWRTWLGSAIPVEVDLATGAVAIDPAIVDLVTKARNDASQKLNIPVADVHVNSIWQRFIHSINEEPIISIPVGWNINVSTPDFTLGYIYKDDGTLTLTSLCSKVTGVDLYASAVANLMSVVNPDSYTLSSWTLNENGMIVFSFALQANDAPIDIVVDPSTGTARMQNFMLEEQITAAREEIARNMGLDGIADVHINSVSLVYYYYKCQPWHRPSSTATIGARVGNYTLTLTSERYGWWNWRIDEPIVKLPMGYPDKILTYEDNIETSTYWSVYKFYWSMFTLTTFVDMTTGVDYVAEAGTVVTDLFNPESANAGIDYWNLTNGKLTLYVNPFHSINPWSLTLSVPISVEIDLATGTVTVDPVIVDLVTKTRNDVSQKLNVPLEDVHINSLWHHSYEAGDIWLKDGWTINVSTPDFTLGYIYKDDGTLTLTSLCSKVTGVDLYASAVNYLSSIFAQDSFSVADWYVGRSGVWFRFALSDGSIAGLYVTVATGEVRMKPDANAFIRIREEMASRLGVDVNDVHINGYQMIFNSVEVRDRLTFGYHITARVNNLDVTMECTPNYGKPGSYSFALVSLVNRETGVDLYASAVDLLIQNGQSEFTLASWGNGDGVLGFVFTLQDGSTIKVSINVTTGETVFESESEIRIDEIATAITAPNTIFAVDKPIQIEPQPQSLAEEPTSEPQKSASPDAVQSNTSTDEAMPGWMQELINELLAKNAATSKGGGSKNVHTYDQMATAHSGDGLSLRWKR